MKRVFKKISVFLVAFVAVLGIVGIKKVSAATVTQQYKDSVYDSASTSISDGWVVDGVSSTSSFNGTSVGKMSSTGTITSPKITGTATQVSVSIVVGTTGTSSANSFTVKAMLNGAEVASVLVYFPSSKALANATSEASSGNTVFTLSATAIDSIQIENTYSKPINVAQIDAIYTLFEGAVDYEALAVTAIDSIGTVSYTEDSKGKIDVATAAVELCDNPSSETVSNYATYTAAIEAFSGLETIAVNEYISAVELISGTDETAYANMQQAIAKYGVLFGDTLDLTNVVVAKASFDEKEAIYYSVNAVDFVDQTGIGSSNGSSGNASGVRIASSIFFLVEGASIDTNNKRQLPNGTTATHRIKLNGNLQYNSGNGKNGVRFVAPSAGKITVYVGTTKDDNALLLANMAGDLVSVRESSDYIENTSTSGTAEEFVLNVPAAGIYFIGGSMGSCDIYYLEFVEYNVSLGNQVGMLSSSIDAARFVSKIQNVNVADIQSISLGMTLTYNNVYSTDNYWDDEDRREEATLASIQGINKVYNSITGLSDSLGEQAENTFWAAYVVTGLSGFNRPDVAYNTENSDYLFYEFKNISAIITVTLTDGTVLTANTTTVFELEIPTDFLGE